MKTKELITNSQQETVNLGERLAKLLSPGAIVCLIGDLGSGKTSLVKGMAKGLKVSVEKVHSPTFVLMNIYEGKLSLYHFDLYRLEDIKEIEAIGYEEFLYGKGIAVIEWADRLATLMPSEYLRIELKHQDENTRQIEIESVGNKYKRLIESLR